MAQPDITRKKIYKSHLKLAAKPQTGTTLSLFKCEGQPRWTGLVVPYMDSNKIHPFPSPIGLLFTLEVVKYWHT